MIGVVIGVVLLVFGFVSFYAGLISLGYKVMADAVAKGNQMSGNRSTRSRTRSSSTKSTTTKSRKSKSSNSGSASVKNRPKSALISKIELTERGVIKLDLDISGEQHEIRRVKIADFHADEDKSPSFILLNGNEDKIFIDSGYTSVSGISLNKRGRTSVEFTVYKADSRKITSLRGYQFIFGLEFHNNSKKEGAVTVPV